MQPSKDKTGFGGCFDRLERAVAESFVQILNKSVFAVDNYFQTLEFFFAGGTEYYFHSIAFSDLNLTAHNMTIQTHIAKGAASQTGVRAAGKQCFVQIFAVKLSDQQCRQTAVGSTTAGLTDCGHSQMGIRTAEKRHLIAP